MSLKSYGVLKGRPIGARLGAASSPHYQVHVIDDTTDYRIAINVKSQESPSELLYLVVEDFQHPLLARLPALPRGFTRLASGPDGLALDFIRANLFDPALLRKLPLSVPGPDNDLNEKIDAVIARAMADEAALVYAFGERWGPEPHTKDAYFGFLPGNGVHDIHMNQGNSPGFAGDDGVWQDGGVIVHFPAAGGAPEQWVAIFLAFQSQAWHTDDRSGHAIPTLPADDGGGSGGGDTDKPPVEPAGLLRIVAALVNPVGGAPEHETVTLLNTTPEAVDLTGWALANKQKEKAPLTGVVAAGATRVVDMPPEVPLSNKGGIITLLDAHGLKVYGVAYTSADAQREGWTIVF